MVLEYITVCDKTLEVFKQTAKFQFKILIIDLYPTFIFKG